MLLFRIENYVSNSEDCLLSNYSNKKCHNCKFFCISKWKHSNSEDLVNSVKIIMSEINQRVMGKDPIVTTGSEQRLAKKSEIDNYYKKLIDLGVVNSNAKIGEFEDLLKDSVNGQSGNFLSKYLWS